jgi:hypothetical protein
VFALSKLKSGVYVLGAFTLARSNNWWRYVFGFESTRQSAHWIFLTFGVLRKDNSQNLGPLQQLTWTMNGQLKQSTIKKCMSEGIFYMCCVQLFFSILYL